MAAIVIKAEAADALGEAAMLLNTVELAACAIPGRRAAAADRRAAGLAAGIWRRRAARAGILAEDATRSRQARDITEPGRGTTDSTGAWTPSPPSAPPALMPPCRRWPPGGGSARPSGHREAKNLDRFRSRRGPGSRIPDAAPPSEGGGATVTPASGIPRQVPRSDSPNPGGARPPKRPIGFVLMSGRLRAISSGSSCRKGPTRAI